MTLHHARLPGSGPPNGLPPTKPYVYRGDGTDTLTPEPLRLLLDREELAAMEVTPDGKCARCGYKAKSRNHITLCGVVR